MRDRKIIQLLNGSQKYEIAFVFCLPGKYRISNRPLLGSKNSTVEFSKGYWLQEITATLGLYEFVYKKPYFELGAYSVLSQKEKQSFPWFGIDFKEVKDFLLELNNIVLANSYTFVFDIPSIAEWEHALLTGKDKTWSWGHDENEIETSAWFRDNSENKIHPSGLKKCNDWGLYDMYGNIYEYCYDAIFNNSENYFLDPIAQTFRLEDTIPCLGGSYKSTKSECQSVRFIGYKNEFIEPTGIRLIERHADSSQKNNS